MGSASDTGLAELALWPAQSKVATRGKATPAHARWFRPVPLAKARARGENGGGPRTRSEKDVALPKLSARDHARRGIAFLRAGDAARAEAELNAAVLAGQADANLYIALGRARSALSRPQAAVEAFAAAVDLTGEDPQALTNLATAQRRALMGDEAVKTYRRALRAAPDHLPALLGLGNAALELGREAEAESAFHQALAVKPGYAKAFASLAKILSKRPAVESAALQASFERALENAVLEPSDRLLVHHAIAVLLDGQGRFDEAFAHFRAFNELRRARTQAGSQEQRMQEIERRIAANERIFCASGETLAPEPRSPTVRPIFILGMPRSATTLVEQILCVDPSVRGGGERIDVQRISAGLEPMDEGYPERLNGNVERLRQEYDKASLKIAAGRPVVTDKMPFNFWHVGLILSLFPDARIIHTVRDPRDTCVSCHFHNFAQPYAFVSDLDELGGYYCAYRRMMARWQELYPSSIRTVEQAQLLANPGEEMRQLVEFAGLSWSDAVLNYRSVERPVLTASSLQVREGLNPTYAGRWQRYASHLSPLLDALQPVLGKEQLGG